MPSTVAEHIHQATIIAMDTVVSVQVVTEQAEAQVEPVLRRALGWFARVERACSRFDPDSELRRLFVRPGEPIQVSPLLFEAVRSALELARATGGVFDPTVGRTLELRGFNRDHAMGELLATHSADASATFRDIQLAPHRTITLRRPLALDLGAVAKGLAIDLAACELSRFEHFCVEAGGALFAGGHNAEGRLWRVGVQDPRDPDALATMLHVADRAVCSSGDYERRRRDGAGQSADGLAGVTVIASTAMAANGLATAAFILGLDKGRRLLERSSVAGVFFTSPGEMHCTNIRGA